MIFLIDFDKTISKQCSCTTMIEKFKISCTDEIEEQWEIGALSTPAATKEILKVLRMTEPELIETINSVEIDSSFIQFIKFCKQNDYEYAIVSDGFFLLITTILSKYIDQPIKIFANQLVCCDSRWTAHFPYHSDESPNLGVCKSQIVKQYQQQSNQPVAFIGDGYTDYQASEVADIVFAKDKLSVYCQEHGIPYIPYNDFNDIITYVKNNTI
ncbi:MtnX-like HAD-IB family phosphatase [Desulfuribacillus alkaliarsenatis]|uniref:2,3-diketo-5-methylthio-1-phosphopentane phosphatase n=1 Tax=Desulfuribacillus alkaliarsenatis TaxID=766136 RepID=A0A1E5G0I7_9FIRM|nr:MtnX-like HAD-IB family phosphatase [Desulfuribacillus alkaliarsenatis]OEF96345.1 hypothetical protein BHF68_09350 [Desulfuribacillus alkaliarsenatis]